MKRLLIVTLTAFAAHFTLGCTAETTSTPEEDTAETTSTPEEDTAAINVDPDQAKDGVWGVAPPGVEQDSLPIGVDVAHFEAKAPLREAEVVVPSATRIDLAIIEGPKVLCLDPDSASCSGK